MRLLADTQILLWVAMDNPRLPQRFRLALTAADAVIHISAVSVFEVTIKHGLGKLIAPLDMFDGFVAAGCIPLPVTWDHARAVEFLPGTTAIRSTVC